MASPAFAATIKLGGDNGELGFFVSAPYRRSHSRRTRVRPRPIAAASKSGCHSAEMHLDTSASGSTRVTSWRESFSVWVSRRGSVERAFFRLRLFSAKTRSQKNSPLSRLSSKSFERQPNKITVAKGETIEFVNNKAFPHNVVFDEDNVPSGVNADAISHEDYLNGPGEKVTNKFDTPGTYGYYCEPHQGAGMQGTIIVQ